MSPCTQLYRRNAWNFFEFRREVNPAAPLAWLVTKLFGCVSQTDNCFKAFYDHQTVEEPILRLFYGFVYHTLPERIK